MNNGPAMAPQSSKIPVSDSVFVCILTPPKSIEAEKHPCALVACRRESLSRRPPHCVFLVSPSEHGQGGGDAGNEDQDEPEDLKQTHIYTVGDGPHEGSAYDEKPGRPAGNHPCSQQGNAQQHIGKQVPDQPDG